MKRGATLRLTLTGDLHHYSRYVGTGDQADRHKITAGGAGAFLSATHTLQDEIHLVDHRYLTDKPERRAAPMGPRRDLPGPGSLAGDREGARLEADRLADHGVRAPDRRDLPPVRGLRVARPGRAVGGLPARRPARGGPVVRPRRLRRHPRRRREAPQVAKAGVRLLPRRASSDPARGAHHRRADRGRAGPPGSSSSSRRRASSDTSGGRRPSAATCSGRTSDRTATPPRSSPGRAAAPGATTSTSCASASTPTAPSMSSRSAWTGRPTGTSGR